MWAAKLLGPMIAGQFALAYVFGTRQHLNLLDYAAGHERLPFQYRALVAWIMRGMLQLPGLDRLVPDAVEGMTKPMLVLAILVFVSVLWINRVARQVAATLFADPLVARLMGLTFLATLYLNYESPAYYPRLGYPYDLPSLALIFAGFAALVRNRVVLLLVLFAVATISRETSVILIPILLCWHWPMDAASGRPALLPRRREAILALSMAGLWVGEKAFLHALYGTNISEPAYQHRVGVPGSMELMFFSNLIDIVQPLRWPVDFSELCWLWLPVFLFWHLIDHPPLRRCIRVITPYWLLIMCLFGALRETRVLGELTILYWMAGLVIVRALLPTLAAAARTRPLDTDLR
jgi:hypothetical protein